jgi:hypothetical protein
MFIVFSPLLSRYFRSIRICVKQPWNLFVADALACSGELQFAEDCRLKPTAAR